MDADLTSQALVILLDTLSFGAKAFLVFITVAATAGVLFALSRKARRAGPHIEIRRLNDRIRQMREVLRRELMEPKAYKAHRKALEREARKGDRRRNVFVLTFEGDTLAGAVDCLREEITAVLGVAGPGDEVVLRLESPGGVVHGYGLAASQLRRLRDRGVRLVVCVDKVAASGGYMMACVADEILAAPFAIVGSIGVASPVPNVHRLLDRVGIDYDEMAAGEFKRTVSYFGEITPEKRAKHQEHLEDIHAQFKEFVHTNRPGLDIDRVATGEMWLGARALELGLVNRVMTSDDYLISHLDDASLWAVTYKKPLKIRERLQVGVSSILADAVTRLLERWAPASALR